jgi:hypothetical protein
MCCQKGIWEKDNKVRKNRAIKKSATFIEDPQKQSTIEIQKHQNNSITGDNKNEKKLNSQIPEIVYPKKSLNAMTQSFFGLSKSYSKCPALHKLSIPMSNYRQNASVLP